MCSLTDIRTALRTERMALTEAIMHAAGQAVALHCSAQISFQNACTVALYSACHHELPTLPLMHWCFEHHKRVLLPRVHHDMLLFVQHFPDAPLAPNRWGIPEPAWDRAQAVLPEHIDVVCMPVVAYTGNGTRIGMGGGFYDRTFAFRRARKHHPHYVGLAYAFQEIPTLASQPWDVRLDSIATETGFLSCTG